MLISIDALSLPPTMAPAGPQPETLGRRARRSDTYGRLRLLQTETTIMPNLLPALRRQFCHLLILTAMTGGSCQALAQQADDAAPLPPEGFNEESAGLPPLSPPPVSYPCGKPAYPKDAIRNEQQGTVGLLFLVGTNGKILDAKIVRSSGSRSLDLAARDGYLNCKFKTNYKDGKPARMWMPSQYVWSLD